MLAWVNANGTAELTLESDGDVEGIGSGLGGG